MNDHLQLYVRRFDGSYRVTARDRELEHTHLHRFPTWQRAKRFLTRVRQALDAGGDLNLRHWEYSGP